MSAANTNVLLLTFARRGEGGAIQAAMAGLAERVPGAHVIAVGTPVSVPILRACGVTDILVYGEGRSARQVIEEAQLFMPEAAGIVYNHPRFGAHLKLEALALVSGARSIWCFRPEGEPMRIGRLKLCLGVTRKGLQMLLLFSLAKAVTALACCYLCWHGRSRGERGENRA